MHWKYLGIYVVEKGYGEMVGSEVGGSATVGQLTVMGIVETVVSGIYETYSGREFQSPMPVKTECIAVGEPGSEQRHVVVLIPKTSPFQVIPCY